MTPAATIRPCTSPKSTSGTASSCSLAGQRITGGGAELAGSTLIPVGFTPVPYTTLQAAMRWHGVDPASVNLMGGLSAEEMLGRFRNGDADYLQVPNPFAVQLVNEGSGHIAATLGNESGFVCYSSFAVTPAYLADHPDTVQRFVNGYARAQRWVAASPRPKPSPTASPRCSPNTTAPSSPKASSATRTPACGPPIPPSPATASTVCATP